MADKQGFKVFYVLTMATQIGFLVAVPLILFLLGGIFLDKRFNSSPWFLILSIIVAFIFIFFEVRQFLLPLLRDKKQ